MKRKTKILALLVVLFSFFLGYASNSTKNDPLVSLSYLDKRLEAFKLQIKDEVSKENLVSKKENNENDEKPKIAVFEIINLSENKKIMFGDSVEFILRSGEAVVSDHTSNGIADLTSGGTVRNGEDVSKNHHMLVPRNDGRGIRTITPIWIMIKGDYLVDDAN